MHRLVTYLLFHDVGVNGFHDILGHACHNIENPLGNWPLSNHKTLSVHRSDIEQLKVEIELNNEELLM